VRTAVRQVLNAVRDQDHFATDSGRTGVIPGVISLKAFGLAE
jgi:hypothetical protein